MTDALDFARRHSRTYMALLRKDLKGYFDQPTGYVLLVIFVAVLSWLYFRGALGSGEASLRPLFDFMPFVLAVFVPAATMRLLAEELRDGTLELLLTQPLRTWTVLGAKFTAGLVFVTVGITLTIGIPILIAATGAGDLDGGAAAAQYVGAVFFSASFVAVGLFTSSITRNQIVAFILALFINFVLILIGLSFLTLTLPSAVAILFQDLSPITHLTNISRGVIDLRDIIYFIALTVLFLSGAYLMLRGRTLSHQTQLYKNLRLGVAGLVLGSILAGWFGAGIGGRWDLTEDKFYTLSPATEDLVGELDDLLTINLYASNDLPIDLSGPSRDIESFLQDIDAQSDLVRVVRHTTEIGDQQSEAEAQAAGIPPRQFNTQTQGEFQVKIAYLGMTLSYTDKREVIPSLVSGDGLEYRIATLTNKMARRDKQTVGFLTGHGEKARTSELRLFDAQLSEQYDVIDVRPDSGGNLDLSSIDVIIIAGPTQPLTELEQDQLDAFFAGGGKGLVLSDTTLTDFNRLQAVPNNGNNLNEFLLDYGVFVHENLVMDTGSFELVTVDGPQGTVSVQYPFWIRTPTVERKISGNTESATLTWAASIELDNATIATVDRHIHLLQTSEFGALQFDYGDISTRDTIDDYELPSGGQGSQLMAVGVSGTVTGNGTAGDDAYRMVVVGDSDWLSDSIASIGQNNLVLALNWMDWLAQEEALASIRSKIVRSRDLTWTSDTEKNFVQYFNIAGVPVLVILFGAFRFIRRRQFTQKIYEAHASRDRPE